MRRRVRTVRTLRVEHYSSAVNKWLEWEVEGIKPLAPILASLGKSEQELRECAANQKLRGSVAKTRAEGNASLTRKLVRMAREDMSTRPPPQCRMSGVRA